MGFLKLSKVLNNIRNYCSHPKETMTYLCVAEKNDAAKNIASLLSRGASNRREGLSPYNKIYEFTCQVFSQPATMVMTSVSGHLLNYEFAGAYRNWRSCNPLQLFDAPIHKQCMENYDKIKRTLEQEIRRCNGLIIWTDCDREGENIGFEVIKVCSDVKPGLRIHRAKFSEITRASILRALNNLQPPDKNVSDAVDVRQELDLRTGAAFTRLQTLRLQKVFPRTLSDKLISYGSCQFPTLGFVVERYQAIENFIPERFWKIKLNHTVKDITTDFLWKRERLFEKTAVEAILDICNENPLAAVEKVESKSKNKWRPLPLDTVEMEKNISRKLRINAKEVMKIAEKLYTQGLISYPRTETNIFPKELNLQNLVEAQREDNQWGAFAHRVLNEGGPNPRHGKKTDQAHPPIHPLKYAGNLQGNEQRVYEYIVRHFLACVHKDAVGHETSVHIDVAGEKFTAKGLLILERNYLDVYIYEKWNAKEINNYQEGDTFMPTVMELMESSTAPPKLLTEADLIALMEKHGIGTDATHAEHIETIKSREYVGLQQNMYFVPATLGMGLVEGYNNIGLEISLAQPTLRADFENDLKLICEGRKDPAIVRTEQIRKYKEVFTIVAEKMRSIDTSLAVRLNDEPADYIEDNVTTTFKPVLKCPKCGSDMILKDRKNGGGKYLTCTGYPDCKNAAWFSLGIFSIEVTDQTCAECGPNVNKLKIHFKQNPFLGEPNPNVLCVGGCDAAVLSALDISLSSVKKINRPPTTINNSHHTTLNTNPTIPTGGNRTNQPNNNAPQNTRNNPYNGGNRPDMGNRSDRGNDSGNGSERGNRGNRSDSGFNSGGASSSSRFIGNQSNVNLLPGPSNSNYNQGGFNNRSPHNPPDNEIFCHCDKPANLLVVKNDGVNKGRKYFKCTTYNGGCDFFLWAPDENTMPNNDMPDESDQVECKCRMPAIQRTVNKESVNKGRNFFCCPKSMGQQCDFFEWADQRGNAGGNSHTNNYSNRGGNNNNNKQWKGKAKGKSKTNTNTNKPPYTKKPRKCGQCGEEGHMKNRCPNK